MVLDHYGLREPPFSITPDPRFVFLSERHRDALAHLLYGVGQGGGSGFVQLTGEVGTGKTTLSRLLLEQLPDTTRVALILNPSLSPVELLEAICEELRIDLGDRRGNPKALVDALNAFLLEAYAAGLRVVLIVDEAQNLSRASLEQVRLLTNLETPTQKLLQIILLGQPELREQLARPDLRQLAQRITARYHLDPLDADESEAYLRHRWAVAGGTALPFTRGAIRRLHRYAGGVPRLLNVIAERALLAGYARGEQPIGERLLARAAAEVLPRGARSRAWPAVLVVATAVAVVIAMALTAPAWWPSRPATTAARRPTVHVPRPPAVVRQPARPALPELLGTAAFAERLAAASPDRNAGLADLLAQWNVRANAGAVADATTCAPVLAPGLFCATGRARLARLAQLDRPVLLHLRAGGHEARALLLGLGTTQALLRLDGTTIRVQRAALEDATTGYAAIWRGPDWLTPPLRIGDTGAGVDWLRKRLLPAAATEAGAAGTRPFDTALALAVRAVQRDAGLRDDGVAGPETLFALAATDPDGPRLQRLPE